MLRLAPGSPATSGKRSLVLRTCNDAPLGKVIAAVGLPLASTVGAVTEVGCNVCAAPIEIAMQFTLTKNASVVSFFMSLLSFVGFLGWFLSADEANGSNAPGPN